MTKPKRSTKTPAKGTSTPSRQEVRQEVHRSNVPRQSQRPVERSNQTRNKKT